MNINIFKCQDIACVVVVIRLVYIHTSCPSVWLASHAGHGCVANRGNIYKNKVVALQLRVHLTKYIHGFTRLGSICFIYLFLSGCVLHHDVIKRNIFRLTGPVWGESTGDLWVPLKGQLRGVWMYYLMCAWTNGWAKQSICDGLRRYGAHFNVTVMSAIEAIERCQNTLQLQVCIR